MREHTLSPEKSADERRIEAALDASLGLRQLADEALEIYNAPDRQLRPDLHAGALTLAHAAEIADKLLTERYELGQKLSMNAQTHHFNVRDAQRSDRFKLPEVFDKVDYEVPLLRQGQRLEFVRMAQEDDLIRAEVHTPDHRDILETGVPLQSLKGYAVIGLPPGDLERTQDDLKHARNRGELAYGVYKITNALYFKDYTL